MKDKSEEKDHLIRRIIQLKYAEESLNNLISHLNRENDRIQIIKMLIILVVVSLTVTFGICLMDGRFYISGMSFIIGVILFIYGAHLDKVEDRNQKQKEEYNKRLKAVSKERWEVKEYEIF